MRSIILACVAAGALAACSEENSPRQDVEQLEIAAAGPTNEFGFMESMEQSSFQSGADRARNAAQSAARMSERPSTEDQKPGTQIAYTYSWGFHVAAPDLSKLQERHRALCTSMGRECQVLSLSQSGNHDYAYGRMRLKVAADKIAQFSAGLRSEGDTLDAELISQGIAGEDLTDDIIDTEAHLEARTALRERLMEVLRTRKGSVGDLVAAERGVAEVNEEIDAAASRLANMRGRISFSQVEIEYDPTLGEYNVGFWAPIKYAFQSVTSTLGVTIAGLIYVLIALIPISIFVLALRWLWRRWRSWKANRRAARAESA